MPGTSQTSACTASTDGKKWHTLSRKRVKSQPTLWQRSPSTAAQAEHPTRYRRTLSPRVPRQLPATRSLHHPLGLYSPRLCSPRRPPSAPTSLYECPSTPPLHLAISTIGSKLRKRVAALSASHALCLCLCERLTTTSFGSQAWFLSCSSEKWIITTPFITIVSRKIATAMITSM